MKKPRTETIRVGRVRFRVPRATAKAVLVLLKNVAKEHEETIFADESEVIKGLDSKYTRGGACLQGARLKAVLTQVELATKLGVLQTNISAMELGKRPIGKRMAVRLSKVLNVDYRIFL